MNGGQRFIVVKQDGYSEIELMDAPSLVELHEKLGEKAGRADLERSIEEAEDLDELCDLLGLGGA